MNFSKPSNSTVADQVFRALEFVLVVMNKGDLLQVLLDNMGNDF